MESDLFVGTDSPGQFEDRHLSDRFAMPVEDLRSQVAIRQAEDSPGPTGSMHPHFAARVSAEFLPTFSLPRPDHFANRRKPFDTKPVCFWDRAQEPFAKLPLLDLNDSLPRISAQE